MKQAWTLRDKKNKEFYSFWEDSDEGQGFMSIDHPVLLDYETVNSQLGWWDAVADRYQKAKGIELELVEIQYTVIEK